MALGTPEHSGKVHGVGAYVTPISYFHTPAMTVNERAFKQQQFYIEQHKKDEERYNHMEAEYKRIIQELQKRWVSCGINVGNDIFFKKNDPSKVMAQCKGSSNFQFVCYTSKKNDSDSFTIKTFNPEHRCGRKNVNQFATAK
ncbi:hypothetical protein TIFTF001_018769 [Ficus carica]|uniref:Uncharacterized protein n=1 Tax=Ficus carica TaxID=3494 RepID=A0AA88DJA2_FICCA|nr:hypothetical protein TIFTF001_018769 [Ficus carica]